MDALQKSLDVLLKSPQLQKQGPISNMNVQQPVPAAPTEVTPLEKAIIGAAASFENGITGDQVKTIMDASGGDVRTAQSKAQELVRSSLAQKGITSSAKIRLLDPATRNRLLNAGRSAQ